MDNSSVTVIYEYWPLPVCGVQDDPITRLCVATSLRHAWRPNMTVLDQITRDGAFCIGPSPTKEVEDEVDTLLSEGLIVRVSDIPHHPKTLNQSYTFVTNDERGKEMAIGMPLFTLLFC